MCEYGTEHFPSVRSKRFVCRCSGHRITRSIFFSSLFSCAKLSVGVVLLIAYDWLSSLSVSCTAVRRGVRRGTVANYYSYFRQIISHDLQINACSFGGYGVTVQIDEMFIAAKSIWILGVYDCSSGQIALFQIANREADTIARCLRSKIRVCSRLVTDALPSYIQVARLLGCVHMVVNKSVQFVNNALKVHTNNVEALWCVLRSFLRFKSNFPIQVLIDEFVWRQNNKALLWPAFLDAMGRIDFKD